MKTTQNSICVMVRTGMLALTVTLIPLVAQADGGSDIVTSLISGMNQSLASKPSQAVAPGCSLYGTSVLREAPAGQGGRVTFLEKFNPCAAANKAACATQALCPVKLKAASKPAR